jgi:SnoaL-like protein
MAATVLLTIALLSQAATGSSSSGVRLEVQGALDRFITAFNQLDWDGFRACLDDEITVFNPDIPEAPAVERLDGRPQVEAGFKAIFDAAHRTASGPPYLHIVPRHLAIQVFGGTAIVSFEFERGQGSIGRRTLVFVRRDRAWRILHIHASNAATR